MSFSNDFGAYAPVLTEFQRPVHREYFRSEVREIDGATTRGGIHPERVRDDFPIFRQRINGRPLVWLDNAATTQKPRCVIARITEFYERENSNVHRAAHTLAARSTDAYEQARLTVQRFINASTPDEIVFVRGATEAINLVAKSWGEENVGTGDEILVSQLEHHANIVPWQQLAAKKGARIRVIPVDDDGQLRLDEFEKLLCERTKLVAVTRVSNALGTITPTEKIVELAHGAGAKVLVDAAQSISHLPTDVQALGADWLVFSGHKVFGPTGIGVLFGREELLNNTSPWQGGGTMIREVTFAHTKYNNGWMRFEAGTANIAGAVGLAAALEYIESLGIEEIKRCEDSLLDYATARLREIPKLRIIGTATNKASVLSFIVDGLDCQSIGTALDAEGIAVRAGHHCAQPILQRFGLGSTVRASLAFYNTLADVDALAGHVGRLAKS